MTGNGKERADATVVVSWTRAKLEQFKLVYGTAKKDGATSIFFDNNEYLMSYAKYLIEYLDGRLPR